MARRGNKRKSVRRAASKASGFLKKIPIIRNPTFQKAAAGIGTVALATQILTMVGQGQIAQQPIVKLGLAFAGGDIIGLGTQLVLGGGLGNLSNMFGGNGGGNGGMMVGGA